MGLVPTVSPALGVAHVPSPRQNVELLALVPLFKFATGRLPVTPVVSDKPVAFVSVKLAGVPPAPLNNTGAPALPVLMANAVAMPVPRPDTPVDIGSPVALVSVPLDGVPNAPPLTTNAPDEPVLTANAVKTPVPGTVTPNVPAPPEVVTRPLLVKLLSVAIFCEVLTVTVFVERVRPVENVSGTS